MGRIRIDYLDDLKMLAIFGIILIHVAILWPDAQIQGHNLSVFFSVIGRFGVPVFLMITGALFLGRGIPSIPQFYKNRIIRVILPYILWILVFTLLTFYIWKISDINIGTVRLFLDTFLNNIGWYTWMIIGVILAIPFINEFIIHRKFEEVKYWIIIIIFASIFYQICIFFNQTTFLDLRFFCGPLAYILLGYYFSRKEFNISPNKMILICLVLFILMTVLKNKEVLSTNITHMIVNTMDMKLTSHLDLSPIQLVQSVSIFLLFKNIHASTKGFGLKIKKFLKLKPIRSFILSTSKSSYGMYLAHITVLVLIPMFFRALQFTGSQTFFVVIILSILTFLITWIAVLILGKIPVLDKFSGYH